MPSLHLFIEESSKRAYRSLYTTEQIDLPDFINGETVELAVTRAARLPQEMDDGRKLDPLPNEGNIKAGFGKADLYPIAGVIPFRYDQDKDGDYQTADPVPFLPSAGVLESALNDLSDISGEGGVGVTLIATGTYSVRWEEAGARGNLSADYTFLAPKSIVECSVLIEGQDPVGDDPGLNHVVIVRIMQDAAASGDLEDDLPAATAVVTAVQAGDAGHNQRIRVTINNAYAGKWSLNIAAVETSLVDAFGTEAVIQAQLEASANIGTGNVSVVRESQGKYLITFQGDLGLQNLGAITSNSGALLAIPGKYGIVRFSNPAVNLLLAGASRAEVVLEVQRGESPDVVKMYRQTTTLYDAILEPSSTVPDPPEAYYTADEIEHITPIRAEGVQYPTGMPDGLNLYDRPGGFEEGAVIWFFYNGAITYWELVADPGGSPDGETQVEYAGNNALWWVIRN